jgi:hypothetical protein
MTEIRTRAFVGFAGVVAAGFLTASLSSSGCGSSGGTAGTTGGAGTSGHAGTSGGGAGTTGTAGTTGGGAGTTGTGGAAALCTGGTLAGAPLVTDFSDVGPTDGGAAGNNSIPGKGGILGYGGVTVAIESGHAHVTGTSRWP